MALLDIFALAHPPNAYSARPGGMPFGRTPVLCDQAVIGSVAPQDVHALKEFGDILDVRGDDITLLPGDHDSRSYAMTRVAQGLKDRGLVRGWRNERCAVAKIPGSAALFEIERAAVRFFGFWLMAVHLNIVTEKGMWIATRSERKSIDPGLLDNAVAGGVCAGQSANQTLVKEAWEEAGITESLARTARHVSTLGVCRMTASGLQRERLFAYDLLVGDEFEPLNQDGEVAQFQLQSFDVVLRQLKELTLFSVDAGLVTLDCLVRHEHVPLTDLEHAEIRDALKHTAQESLAAARFARG